MQRMSDYNTAIIEEFRANAGKVGGRWEGRELLLLTTTGRRTGEQHTAPLIYGLDGENPVIVASQDGIDVLTLSGSGRP